MSKSRFNVLASIYKLLSESDAEMLLDASRQPNISSNIRHALAALAAEASHKNESVAPPVSVRFPKRHGPSCWTPTPPVEDDQSLRPQLFVFLSNRRRFPNKDALAVLGQQLSLNYQVNPKWGQPRAIAALVRAIMANPAAAEKLKADMRPDLDPATSGWIDVIRRPK